jgi:hypothetical protein
MSEDENSDEKEVDDERKKLKDQNLPSTWDILSSKSKKDE